MTKGNMGDSVSGRLLGLANYAVKAYAALGEASNPAEATQRASACQEAMDDLAKLLAGSSFRPPGEPAASVRELLRLRIEMQAIRFFALRAEAAAWLLDMSRSPPADACAAASQHSIADRIERWSDTVEHIAQYAVEEWRGDHIHVSPETRTLYLRRDLQFLAQALTATRFEDELKTTRKRLPTLDEVQALLRDVDALIQMDEAHGGEVYTVAQ